jgi:AI-2 transport protein TqsA
MGSLGDKLIGESAGGHKIIAIFIAGFGAAGLYLARPVFEPVAFAVFTIALVWPVQKKLQVRVPTLLAMIVTLALTIVVVSIVGFLVVWGVGQVGHWLLANVSRFQQLYQHVTTWLDGHGIFVTGIIVERFDVGWLIGFFNGVAARANYLIGFSLLVLIFTMLGLLEVPHFVKKLDAMTIDNPGRRPSQIAALIAAKFRRYMAIRSLASVLTGLAIWLFAYLVGLELAIAWGVISFALNYIPFIGPLVATLLATGFAAVQFESLQMAILVFVGLNVIQFLIGSYLEPSFAGASLSISPFVVLFSVFFWGFLWGIPGAFIGVPLTIAMITVCAEQQSTHWIAQILSGPMTDTADDKLTR